MRIRRDREMSRKIPIMLLKDSILVWLCNINMLFFIFILFLEVINLFLTLKLFVVNHFVFLGSGQSLSLFVLTALRIGRVLAQNDAQTSKPE